jgi:hypothetical protein
MISYKRRKQRDESIARICKSVATSRCMSAWNRLPWSNNIPFTQVFVTATMAVKELQLLPANVPLCVFSTGFLHT